MIGEIISVGAKGTARWMYVTYFDMDCVKGRMWSARKEKWTKTSTIYSRDAIGKKQPNCARPRPPISNFEAAQ
jgi:hypothetical protein